jgi:prepilin-type N-terminal cleavage/methylation domain-containing protein
MKNLLRKNGFTLVEVVVASILLAIVAAGIFSIIVSSKKIITSSSQRRVAIEVAETVLDNLRRYLGADQWDNDTSPIYTTGGWSSWYSLHDHTTELSIAVSTVFDASDFDNIYQGGWRYRIDPQLTQCAGGECDYRKAEVEVNWTEVEL